MKKQIRSKWERGFTLVETLAVTAILIILLGLSIVGAVYYRDLLKITELDNAAREIYLAAENRAVLLSNGGRLGALVKQTGNGVRIPISAQDADSGEDKADAYYIAWDKTDLDQLLPMGSVEPALRDGQFYIVYEPVSGCVTDVFYTQGDLASLTGGGFQAFYDRWTAADRSERMRLKPMLGYYKGGSAQGGAVDVHSPKVQVTIDNGERLTATVSWWLPSGIEPDAASLEVELSCGGKTVELTDAVFEARKIGDSTQKTSSGVNYSKTWVLDELGSEKRFQKLFQYTGTPRLGGDFQITATLTSKENAFEQVQASDGDNSLFAEETRDGAVAYIKYLRHLQNLDKDFSGVKDITGAVQAADILCRGNETYGDYLFQAIGNPSLTSYNGGEREIRGLSVAAGADIGLFSTAKGVTFTNVRLVNATVNAQNTGNAGALAGKAVDSTFNGCWVYWEPEQGGSLSGILGSDAKNDSYHPQIIGTNAGGLVGEMRGGTIENCLAATIVSGQQAGGLIGRAASSGSVTVTNSYADCYLTGTAAAGLIGDLNGSCTLTNCYAAGFIVGDGVQSAAGLCLGTGATTANHVYSVMRYPTQFGPAGSARDSVYMLTQRGGADSFADTYYLNSGNVGETGVEELRRDYAQMTARPFKQDMGSAFAWKDAGDSRPYNLREHLSLVVYSFPGLASLPHYGDWGAQFQEPSLVYYEQYNDKSYGFSGGNARYLIGELKDGSILSDGYAVAFLTTDMQGNDKAVIKYTDFSSGGQKQVSYSVSGTAGTEKLIETTWKNDEGNKASYYLALLPKDMVNGNTCVEEIYQYLRFDLTIGEETSSGVYFYNPHFAETVIPYVEKDGDAAIQWDAETARKYAREELLEQGRDVLSVRTPRHLYDLGRFEAYYHNTSHRCTFRQGLDLDYAAYTGYGLFTEKKPYVQTPIGSEAKPFTGVYDGGCRAIKNVVFQIPGGSGNQYAGLFGCSVGTLRNIVYRMDLDSALAAVRDDGSGALYVGGLLGLNQGTVVNCAVSGVRLDGMAFGATLYLGGLVGRNEGVVEASAAECAGMTTDSSSYAHAYMGGLVGQNDSTVTASYAVGRLEAKVDGTSSAWVCGFAGGNSSGITSSYAAVDLKSDGLNVETYGFCPGGSTGCAYLDEGNFTYRASSYTASYGREGEDAAGKQYSVLAGKPSAVAGMSLGAYADGGEAYPYPTALVDAGGKPVHYGEYPKLMDLGQMGVYYWEKLSNGRYYISLLAVKPAKSGGVPAVTKLSTLLTAHDDGLVAEDYGYGCYEQSGLKVTLTAEEITYRATGGGEDKFTKDSPTEAGVDNALAELMPGFTFHSFLSFDPNGAAGRGLYPTGKPNGELTLKQGTLSVAFELNPHFADAMAVKAIEGKAPAASGWDVTQTPTAVPGTSANPYGVRSVAQLELINWNSTTKNTRTVLGAEGNDNYTQFPYLSYSYGKDNRATRNYVWVQSHDLNGGGKTYTPIAEYYDAASDSTGKLYGWFGGTYDGDDYVIENVNIQGQKSSCAGLFGLVYDGSLNSIILYSSSGTGTVNSGYYPDESKSVWYAMGCLAGFAASSEDKGNAVENCSVSGYTVNAKTYTSGGWGGSNIGGLLGISNMDLQNCSAVTKIEVKSGTNDNDNMRVGGLVGACQDSITNCYAGGSISLEKDVTIAKGLYIGGIVGGSYFKPLAVGGDASKLIGEVGTSPNVNNKPTFSKKNDTNNSLANCYSYVELPNVKSHEKLKSLYVLGGTGEINDCTGWGETRKDDSAAHGVCTMTNCFYLENKVLKNNKEGIEGNVNGTNDAGQLDKCTKTDLHRAENEVRGLDYQQLAGQKAIGGKTIYDLLTAFAPVTTTTADGFSVAGKYSYAPADRTELQGMDYPFPTILTRDGGKNHVHYGEWPLGGIERASGGKPIALDLLSRPGHTETLELSAGVLDPAGAWSVDGYDDTIITAGAASSTDSPGQAVLTVNAVRKGTTKLTVHYRVGQTDHQLRLTVNVTEELELFPWDTALFPGGSFTLPLEPRGRDPEPEPDGDANPPLPVANLTVNKVNALYEGLSCTVAQAGFEAGTEGGKDKLPAIALSADAAAQPGPAVVNVDYTYIHGRDETNEGTSYTKIGTITATILALPEPVYDETAQTYTLDFSPFELTHGLSIQSVECGAEDTAVVELDGTIITISKVKEGTQSVPLTISLTMDGLAHSVALEVPVGEQTDAPEGA